MGAPQVVDDAERHHRDRREREPQQRPHVESGGRPGQQARDPRHAQHRERDGEPAHRRHRLAMEAPRSGMIEHAGPPRRHDHGTRCDQRHDEGGRRDPERVGDPHGAGLNALPTSITPARAMISASASAASAGFVGWCLWK